MNVKQITYLVIAVVVLFALYFLLKAGSVPKAEETMFVEVDTAQVTEISIYHEGATTTLARGDNGWNITNPFSYPANNGFVKTLLVKLDDMRQETTVSGNKDRWAEFEVDDNKATRITLTQNGKSDEFYIGKAASGYKQTYARLAGKDDIFLIKGTYGVAVNRKPEAWREKKIADFTAEEVTKIITANLQIAKEGEDWRVTPVKGESFIADQSKAERVAKSYQNLRTSDFPEADEYKNINWDKPDKEATLELSTGDSRVIRIYQQPDDDNRYFLRYHNSDTVFRIYKGIMNQLFKEVDDLKAEPKEEAPVASQ